MHRACLRIVFALLAGFSLHAQTPVILAVVNGLTLTTTLSPGDVAAVFGTNLPASAAAGALVGGQTAQVLYASATQWNVVIPGNATAGPSTMQVGTSAPFPITLSQSAPELVVGASGAIILAERVLAGSLPIVSASAPAMPGDTLYIFATGLGAADASGHPSPMPTVTVGGQQVTVVTAVIENAGVLTGTYQVTIQLPATTPAGNLPVVMSFGGASSQPLTLPVGSQPLVTAVVNGASFLTGIVPGSWITVWGTHLTSVTDNWNNSIAGGQFPTKLDGVSVSIGGEPGYIYYLVAGQNGQSDQINLLAPDCSAGAMQVTVTNSAGTSPAFTVACAAFEPAFFLWPNNYVVATYTDYTWAVKNGEFQGPTTVPAKPGDTLILWGTGFGPTTPAAPVGEEPAAGVLYSTTDTVGVTIGAVPAKVIYSVLSGYAGLYQIAIQVPSVPNGDQPIVATVGGVASPTTTLITVQQ